MTNFEQATVADTDHPLQLTSAVQGPRLNTVAPSAVAAEVATTTVPSEEEVAMVDLSAESATVMEFLSLRLSVQTEVPTGTGPRGPTAGARVLPLALPLGRPSMMRNLHPL